MKSLTVFWRSAVVLAALALCLTGASNKHPYSPHEKAFYADATTVAFIRPGLAITINSAQIAADGTITTVFTLTDPAGLPLDLTGVDPASFEDNGTRRVYPEHRNFVI